MGGDNAVRYGNDDYSSIVTAPPSPAINPNDTKMEAAQSSPRFRSELAVGKADVNTNTSDTAIYSGGDKAASTSPGWIGE